MKYTPKQYARALYEILAEKGSKNTNSVIRDFVNVLRKNNDLSKGNEVMNRFEEIYHEESGMPLFEVSAADDRSGEILNKKIKGEVNFKKDQRLIGGARVRIGDEMVDNTLRARLERLRGALTK